jgi:hypothetical protein
MVGSVGMDGKPKEPMGFNEWTKKGNRVNISTGCENDCVYCYAKLIGYDNGWAAKGQWHNMVLRQNEVEKGRRQRKGRFAFPSSHDITPSILEPYLIVLGKLLRAGNEVLIVSKPRDACIRSICESFGDYAHLCGTSLCPELRTPKTNATSPTARSALPRLAC